MLYKKDLVTRAEVDAFKKECGYLLANLVEKILERSPLGSAIVHNASVLDPRDVLMISMEEAEKKMKSILNHLINLTQVAPVFSDKVLSQFTDFLTESKVCQDMFIEFNKESDRFDDFYFKKCNINRYKELVAVVKILLTLSHGQASAKRGFSENNTVLTQNMKMESIVAHRLIKDHLVSNSLQAQTINITNEMMLSVKMSHQRYKDHQTSLAKSEKVEGNDAAKIILNQEIRDVQAKFDQLKKISEMLQN